jgi:integrase
LAAADDRFRPVFAAMAFAGLRVGEAMGLQWRNVDFAENTLTIDGKINNRGVYEPWAKTEASEATLTMLPALKRELAEHRKRQAAKGFGLVAPDAFVFINVGRWGDRGEPRLRVLGSYNLASDAPIERAKRMLREDPTLTRRAVAEAAGVSEGTAGNARNLLVAAGEIAGRRKPPEPPQRHLTYNVVHPAFVKAADAAGLNPPGVPKISPHDLRHTCVALALHYGATIVETRELARHSDVTTTMSVYAGLMKDGKGAAVRKMLDSGFGA